MDHPVGTHRLRRRSGPQDALLSPSLPSTPSKRAQAGYTPVPLSSSPSTDLRYASSMGRQERGLPLSVSNKYAISPDPSTWGGPLTMNMREDDDYLHNPDPKRDRDADGGSSIFTLRGLGNLGCLLILGLGLLILFAGYPIITALTVRLQSKNGGFGLGGINGTGQVPSMAGNWGLIDLDTPREAYTKPDYHSGKDWQLVWSDEFNVEGRTFYPGDDPYWEAVDLHYWQTNNIEWYDPAALMTRNGSLEITLSAKPQHRRNYTGGMMSTWNKFCFTGGIAEASIVLPGANNILGLWPAFWMMGNLGRVGYGGSLEGTWPYTYDSCDVGTVKNQTRDGLPIAATMDNDMGANGALSYLPGQRLSRCTCPGESHPGPIHADGTYVGRSAPEIDVFEATISGDPPIGKVSQSLQLAPFTLKYQLLDMDENMIIYNTTLSEYNTYKGASNQQAASVVTITDQAGYELGDDVYSVYGVQYKPGFDDAYVTWITDGKMAWTIKSGAIGPDPRVEIDARPIPQEPMYLILNLGLSENFGFVDFEHLTFPAVMKVDWVRVYQDPDAINIGCDPIDFPTAEYIRRYPEAYTNANLTTWVDDYKQEMPKNSWMGQC